MPTTESPSKNKILLDIYDVEQLINEPTRITATSSTLIDLCLTNTPINVVKSGVIHVSISDHLLVYMIRKAHYIRGGPRTIYARTMKNFNRELFPSDLALNHWDSIYCSQDSNEMFDVWKKMLMHENHKQTCTT